MRPEIYQRYLQILHEEVVPALGCTEPIAIAFAAAWAKKLLGTLPERLMVQASGSIIKNVKSVIVPNTGHLKGIEAACAAGVIAGDTDAELEVLSGLREDQIPEIKKYMDAVPITVSALSGGPVFNLIVTAFSSEDVARVQIADHHTQIVLLEKNGEVLFQKDLEDPSQTANRDWMSVEGIWEFITELDIADVSGLFDKVISCNMAIAREGLLGNYGANVGSTLLYTYGDGMYNRAKAYAAAGSDARMDGCELPVYINSGSGNQGIVCSVPVIICARELGICKDQLYRALALSNLIAIHEKTGIGTLSAYCGAVSAGAAAGAAIAYLSGGGYKEVAHTLVNAVAIDSGMICDGAKASCAAKIASAVDAGIFGFLMYQRGQEFLDGDGIVVKGVENTIRNVGRLGREGMRGTNEEIIRMMTGD
ncbi:MAG: L-serine ammonia-lyase, iron-sulfur-dependent, subunit alpha [Clostridiales bacterium]|nr:L-serine ammonia-lyase, iron-sulfur-dependent, subunit alpha [Clostridiales bacterium]